MLVLGRRVDEQIQIGDDITITVVRIRGDTVRIGIEAPDGVNIARTELLTQGQSNEEPGQSA